MNNSFSKKLEEAHKTTLRYSVNKFKRACEEFYDSINDWLIDYFNAL